MSSAARPGLTSSWKAGKKQLHRCSKEAAAARSRDHPAPTVFNAARSQLALLWQIYWIDRLIASTGFPNQIFSGSWVSGIWRADHGGQGVELGR